MSDVGSVDDIEERLREIDGVISEYKHAADNRGEDVATANYRNVQQAIRNVIDDLPEKTTEPTWDETPVTLTIIEQLVGAHPEYTLTSQHGPDGHEYTLIQFYDEEPNHQASSAFLSMVNGLNPDGVDDE